MYLKDKLGKNKTKLNRRRGQEPSGFVLIPDDEEEEIESSIIKRKDIVSKPMSEEEAVLQMELLGHDFFVFKNVDEECVSVLYKRKDGNYGIINSK